MEFHHFTFSPNAIHHYPVPSTQYPVPTFSSFFYARNFNNSTISLLIIFFFSSHKFFNPYSHQNPFFLMIYTANKHASQVVPQHHRRCFMCLSFILLLTNNNPRPGQARPLSFKIFSQQIKTSILENRSIISFITTCVILRFLNYVI